MTFRKSLQMLGVAAMIVGYGAGAHAEEALRLAEPGAESIPPPSATSPALRLTDPTSPAAPAPRTHAPTKARGDWGPTGGEVERGVGVGLSMVGVAGFASAAVFMLGTGSFSGEYGALGLIIAAVPAGVGVVFSAVGIPLWIDGQARVNRERENAHAPTAKRLVPSFVPLPSGGVVAGLGGTF